MWVRSIQVYFHCQWLIVFQTDPNDQAHCMVSGFVCVFVYSCSFDCMRNAASQIDREKTVLSCMRPIICLCAHFARFFCVCVCKWYTWSVCDREWAYVCGWRSACWGMVVSLKNVSWNADMWRSKYLSSGDKRTSVSCAPDYRWCWLFFFCSSSRVWSLLMLMLSEECF